MKKIQISITNKFLNTYLTTTTKFIIFDLNTQFQLTFKFEITITKLVHFYL